MLEITAAEYRKKKKKDSLGDFWDNIKHTNTLNALQGSQKEKREKGPQKIFEEIIAESFPNIGKEIANSRKHSLPGRINPRRNTLRHIIIKLTKIKDKGKILKTTSEK